MIKKYQNKNINDIMKIWLETNIKAHNFISEEYWKNNFEFVKNLLPQAEIYIYEENKKVLGFIGLQDNYIAGIFVNENSQSKGIGKSLLNFVKNIKDELILNVYEKNSRAVKFYERENFILKEKNIDENTGEEEYMMIWKK